MENEKDWNLDNGLNILSFFRILSIKRAIKNGEKTALNYCILANWYSMFSILNIKQLQRKWLYYALKAVQADKNYAPAYLLACYAYFNLDLNKLREQYIQKAIKLSGNESYMAEIILFCRFLNIKEKVTEAYIIGNKILSHKINVPMYWAISLFIIAIFYGYGVEYKNTFIRYLRSYKNYKNFFNFKTFNIFVSSLIQLWNTIKYCKGRSIMLDALYYANDFENVLKLVNKLIIREHRKNQRNNQLAYLYFTKANALMFKENREYQQAMKALEKAKEYGNKIDYNDYLQMKAQYAYIVYDYENAITYINEALLNKTNGSNLLTKGLICHGLEQYEDSIEALLKAIEHDDCDKTYKTTAYHYLCEDYYALGEHNKALFYINQALLISQDAQSYYLKANVLEAMGKIKESKECFEKFKKLEEN